MTIAVFFCNLSNPLGLHQNDEDRYYGVAREMLARGDWLVPSYMGEPAFDKPPPLYWVVAGDRLAIYDVPGEFSLMFYTDNRVLPVHSGDALVKPFGSHSRWLVVMPKAAFHRLAQQGRVYEIAAAGRAVLAGSAGRDR